MFFLFPKVSFFFSSRRRHTRLVSDWSSDVCSSGQPFNFGGEKVVKMRELANMIKKLTNSSSELILAPPRTELEREPQVSYPSNRKVEKVLGYGHELSLEEGLKRTIEWVRGGEK